jgi:hypothetical protein
MTTTEQDYFANALSLSLAAIQRLNNLPEGISLEDEEIVSHAYSTLEDRLIATPAATISDLRAKMEVVFHDIAATPRPETLLTLMRDLHSLTGHEPSRYFDPAAWLKWFQRWGGGWVEREGEIILVVPDGPNAPGPIKDVMFELEACDARKLVEQFIRERSPEKHAA